MRRAAGVRRGTTAHPTCVAGALCSTFSRKCETLLGAGASCDTPNECAAGLRCQNHACAATGPDGANAECHSGIFDCKPGLECTSNGIAAGTCVTKKAAGPATCNPSFNGLNECGGLCVKPDGSATACIAFCGAP